MGFQDADDLSYREEKVINPTPTQRMSVAEITSDSVSTTSSAQESSVNINSIADDFRDRIESADAANEVIVIRGEIDSHKTTLGTALFTELKNKAVKRYYMIDHRSKVEAAIVSLPNPGIAEASALFAKAEATLTAAKRHIGDELYDGFRITLDDMKPEYVS